MTSDRILIRSTLTRWPAFVIGGLGLAVIIGAAALAMVPNALWGAVIVAAVGVVFILIAVIREVRRVQQLMWLTLTDTTFTVADNVGERTFNDDDVVSMALRFKENFENGVLKSVTRTFRVWVVTQADRPELIEMTNTMKIGSGDPLAVFIDRITRLLKDRARAERDSGQSILGEGWEIQGKNLIISRPKEEPVEASLDQIVAADYIDNQLKLWREGQDESFAQLPLDSANCHLLKVLLDEEIARRPRKDEGPPPDGTLGRIIFERKPSRSMGVSFIILASILLIVSIGLLIGSTAAHRADVEGFYIGAAATFVASLVFFFIAWYVIRYLFRCQAFGVALRTIFGEKSLRFTEVEGFTYSATRHFHNGVYTGTHLSMTFTPFKDLKKPKIVYSTQVKNVDSSLDEMRDQIAGILAGRMLRAVLAGELVDWTPNITLRPDGLYYKPSGFFGKKPPELLPYPAISGHNLHQGNFLVYQRGKPKPAITEPTSARNFFPGYFAFLALLEKPPSVPNASVVTSGDMFATQD